MYPTISRNSYLHNYWGPAGGGGSHVARLNFKTSRVGVYKCLSLIVGFAVTVAIWPREVVSCRDFILRAVATFWAMSLVGIYPGRAILFICFPSCSLRWCQVSLLQQRYYIVCSYPKVALLHHSPRTPSSTCSYHFSFLSSWCNSHNFQCIILATLSRRLLYSFWANFLHSLTRWHTLSPFSHILNLTKT